MVFFRLPSKAITGLLGKMEPPIYYLKKLDNRRAFVIISKVIR